MSSTPPLLAPRVVLFDLDGTLTEPLLDFAAIRRDMGIAPGRPILEAMLEMTPARRQQADAVLLRHERHAAERATLNPGCTELLAEIRARRIPTAIITRNSLASTRIVLETHRIHFEVLVSREDEPYKPSPEPVRLALRRLGSHHVPPDHVWMVGDGHHDIAAARAAGVRALWISHGHPRDFTPEPCATLQGLPEVLTLLSTLTRST